MSDWLLQTFIAPFRDVFMQKALIGAAVVAVVCGVVGCLVILRRMAFLGDALSHAMLAGIGAGYLFMKLVFGLEAHAPAMLLGSLMAALLTVTLIGFVTRVSRLKDDAAIGIMYCGVFAAGVVLVTVYQQHIHIDLMHFIMGDVLGVSDSDLWLAALVAAVVLSVVILFFRHFQLTSFDPVMAAAIGMPVVLIDYLLTACVSLVVVSAVSMVGVILVVGLLITPAATAYLLSDRLPRMMVLAAFFGVTSVYGGLCLCVWLNSAGGGAIVLFCTLQFLVVLVVAPRYGLLAGWLRRWRRVPQQLVEDILGSLLRNKGGPAPLAAVGRYVSAPAGRLRHAFRNMAREGLVTVAGGKARLTAKGESEALRCRRSHRLWETYLERSGAAAAEIHPRADKLEHLSGNAADLLDDILGHPLRDPHGAEIPADAAATAPGKVVRLSLLREGRRAVVESCGPAATATGLSQGEKIQMRARCDQGKTWVARRADGTEVLLSHAVADDVLVRPSAPA